MAKLDGWIFYVVFTMVPDVRLDLLYLAEIVRPVIGAMARSDQQIRGDQPSSSHRPWRTGFLFSKVQEEFDNSYTG